MIYKLLMRAFPNYYKGNSVYAMFPLVVPEENRDILTDLKKVDEYDFERPKLSPFPKVVSSWSGVTDVLSRPEQFAVPCMTLATSVNATHWANMSQGARILSTSLDTIIC